MKYPVKMGQVAPTSVEQDILFRSTIVPFVAVLAGVMVGYVMIKPTLDDVRFVIKALGQIFPILKQQE